MIYFSYTDWYYSVPSKNLWTKVICRADKNNTLEGIRQNSKTKNNFETTYSLKI